MCCFCDYQQLLIIPDCSLACSGLEVSGHRMHSHAGAAAGTLKSLACVQGPEHTCWRM